MFLLVGDRLQISNILVFFSHGRIQRFERSEPVVAVNGFAYKMIPYSVCGPLKKLIENRTLHT